MEMIAAPGRIVRKLHLLLAILFLIAVGMVSAVAEETHSWRHIQYPQVDVPGIPGKLTLFISNSSASGLDFSIHLAARRDEEPPKDALDASQITARLHLSDGTTELPGRGGLSNRWIGFNGDWSLGYQFPWSANKLEEAWIELRLPQQTYWIELPYGFARNPSDPLVADPDHEEPAFPPAMKNLPAKDLLVPWLFVSYDLGPIQNQWRIELHVSNPFDPRAEAILYREKGRWDLHTPRTAIETQWPGGHHAGSCVGIRLTDLMRRSDDYLLDRGLGPEKGRVWGKVVVKVDDQSYDCVVPSSLFKYVHGVTDPYHKQRLPRPRPVDGDF